MTTGGCEISETADIWGSSSSLEGRERESMRSEIPDIFSFCSLVVLSLSTAFFLSGVKGKRFAI